jgi:hypothetical protein
LGQHREDRGKDTVDGERIETPRCARVRQAHDKTVDRSPGAVIGRRADRAPREDQPVG